MGKKNKPNAIQRQQEKKGDGTISKVQLYSCYASSLIIAVLCLWESQSPEVIAEGEQNLYYVLAVLGVLFSVYIAIRNKAAQAKKDQHAGPRLK